MKTNQEKPTNKMRPTQDNSPLLNSCCCCCSCVYYGDIMHQRLHKERVQNTTDRPTDSKICLLTQPTNSYQHLKPQHSSLYNHDYFIIKQKTKRKSQRLQQQRRQHVNSIIITNTNASQLPT